MSMHYYLIAGVAILLVISFWVYLLFNKKKKVKQTKQDEVWRFLINKAITIEQDKSPHLEIVAAEYQRDALYDVWTVIMASIYNHPTVLIDKDDYCFIVYSPKDINKPKDLWGLHVYSYDEKYKRNDIFLDNFIHTMTKLLIDANKEEYSQDAVNFLNILATCKTEPTVSPDVLQYFDREARYTIILINVLGYNYRKEIIAYLNELYINPSLPVSAVDLYDTMEITCKRLEQYQITAVPIYTEVEGKWSVDLATELAVYLNASLKQDGLSKDIQLFTDGSPSLPMYLKEYGGISVFLWIEKSKFEEYSKEYLTALIENYYVKYIQQKHQFKDSKYYLQ